VYRIIATSTVWPVEGCLAIIGQVTFLARLPGCALTQIAFLRLFAFVVTRCTVIIHGLQSIRDVLGRSGRAHVKMHGMAFGISLLSLLKPPPRGRRSCCGDPELPGLAQGSLKGPSPSREI